jgi:Holliday junction resolvase
MTRRAAKVDANQAQIVSALEAAGATVQSLAAIGKGCPDILIAFRESMFLFEIKRDKAKPNELQKKWHIAWNAPVYVVREPDEALRIIGAIA